jgi:uncharacterized protein YcgI (DUF1989 family)
MPTIPACDWPQPPDGVPADAMTWAEVIVSGSGSAAALARGTHLRLGDVHGGACAHLMLYNGDAPHERLNVADTVKVPWQAYLGPGHPLLSDQGRILATIIADDSGRHDALCAGAAPTRARFINLAAKQGLTARDDPARRRALCGRLRGRAGRDRIGPRHLTARVLARLPRQSSAQVSAHGHLTRKGPAWPGVIR